LENLAKICLQTDDAFLNKEEFTYNDDGCACIFTLLKNDGTLVTTINGNIGDSRTIFARKESSGYTAVACTQDHKPTDAKEKERIEAARGHVSLQRVDGQLALSRAFGDRQLKTPLDFPGEKRKVTANPDFHEEKGNNNDFLFMACDGIFEGDIFSRQDVIDFIAKKLETTSDLAQICADLLDECLERGSHDNMSAMIIQFTDGSDYVRDVEYVPGPYYQDSENDKKFQNAYVSDAESAGFTLEKALALRAQNQKANEDKKKRKQISHSTIL